MSLDHVALIVGLASFAILFSTVWVSTYFGKTLKGQKRANMRKFTDKLDAIQFLPAMWVFGILDVGIWLTSRVVLSYV